MTALRARAWRWMLALPLVAGLHACSDDDAAPNAPAKRVILVTCDTLRADRLGAYGYARPTSPELDAFARDAVLFPDAWSTAASTLPAMSSLLAGNLCDQIGVPNNREVMPAGVDTLPEILRRHGIATAAVVSNYVLRAMEELGDAGVAQGFEHFDDEMDAAEPNRPHVKERRAPQTTAAAIRWLQDAKARGRDRFFLWVHYQDPHGPYVPPADLQAEFARGSGGGGSDGSEPEAADPAEPLLPIGEKSVAGQSGFRQIPNYQALPDRRGVPVRRPALYRDRYDAEIRAFDRAFGDLLDWLRANDLYEDALIVFTADHGEALGEHEFWFCHGENTFAEVVRVPLIVRFPRGADGERAARTAREQRALAGVASSHLDVFPTVLDAFGIARGDGLGASWFAPAPARERIAVQLHEAPDAPQRWIGVAAGRFHLVQQGANPAWLFDRAADPAETKDLAPSRPGLVADLLARKDRLLRDAGAIREGVAPELTGEADEALKQLGY